MLFDVILLVIIAFYAVVTPIIVIKSVKFGMKCAGKPEEAAEEPFFNVPKKRKEPEMSAEDARTMQILANIDRYDGTPNGQVEIK